MDGAFTPTFDEFGGLALALVWLLGLGAAAAAIFHRTSAPRNA
jgi:hypothetical protein